MNSKEGRRTTEDRSQRIGIGLSAFRPTTFRRSTPERSRCGMTLVEVLLAAAILGILAVVVINALFYPRFLAVSSTFKQQAVHAATDALERVFAQSYSSASNRVENPGGRYTLNGRSITNVTTSVTVLGGGANPQYKRVTVTVRYPGGENPVVLETLRYDIN